MYAARPVGSDTFTLLAAAPALDALRHTQHNTTISSKGAEWYYNAYSMGFAGPGDTIVQGTADISDTNASLRLSWHTGLTPEPFVWAQDPGLPPVYIMSGWRAGATTGLNASVQWERLILTATVPVPEPSAALFALGAAGMALTGRRRRGDPL